MPSRVGALRRNSKQECQVIDLKHLNLLCFSIIILAAAPWVAPHQAIAQQQNAAGPPSVLVRAVQERDVTPQFEYVGRVEAVETVDLRARVQGFLQEKNFREGSIVKKGQTVFVIEKAPYEVVVDQRKADLAGAEASLKKSELELARKEQLVKETFASKADLDTAVADAANAKASVLQAQAALRSAELDLSYTDVMSPIEGRISRAKYTVGNLVNTNSEPLARVTSIDPIYVTVAISEKELIQARRQGIDVDNPPVAPFLVLADGSKYPHGGRFDYLDTEVQQTTDTLTARAVFPNPEALLVPGQYVKVIIRQKQPLSALVVPQSAVQKDQKGPFVLVVNRANKVELRYVQTGQQVETDWVVSEGLAKDERVIVQGIQKVKPDMEVKAVEAQS